METLFPEQEIKRMRDSGVISHDEIPIKIGDLIVAENVITRDRRIIKKSILENKKRILKG